MKRLTLAFVMVTILLLAQRSANASVTIGSVSVTSPQGDFGGGFDLVNIINQSGLSGGYVSGVTDFNTFTAATTHAGLTGTGFTASSTTGPQQFTFDLGSITAIDAIAIWNTSSVGAITSFNVFSDSDSNFGNGTTALLVGATALGAAGPSQVFGFGTTLTRFVHVQGLTSLEPPDFYGLAEVVFREGKGGVVPEPASLLVWSVFGAAGLVLSRRRRQVV